MKKLIMTGILLGMAGVGESQTCMNFVNPVVRVEGTVNANWYKTVYLFKSDEDSPVKKGHMAVFSAPYGNPNRKQIGITNVGFMKLGMMFGEGPWYVDATDENNCGVYVEWERDVAVIDNRVK